MRHVSSGKGGGRQVLAEDFRGRLGTAEGFRGRLRTAGDCRRRPVMVRDDGGLLQIVVAKEMIYGWDSR